MTAVAYNASGGNGCISVTANVVPALCAAMQTACADGDYARALELHDKLAPLHQALMAAPSPSGIKYAVSTLGACTELCRVPITPLTNAQKDAIQSALAIAQALMSLGLLGMVCHYPNELTLSAGNALRIFNHRSSHTWHDG